MMSGEKSMKNKKNTKGDKNKDVKDNKNNKGKDKDMKNKDNISVWHYEGVGRWSARRMKIEGELAKVCEPEKLRAEMLEALANNEEISGKMTKLQAAFSSAPVGKVYVYKIKGEIKAVCIFAVEERKLPVSAAEVKASEMSSKRKVDGGKLKEFLDDKDRETVQVDSGALDDETVYELRKCYVKKALYIVPSYEEHREALEKLFRRRIEDAMGIYDVDAYVWDDELVMGNMVKESGRYVSSLSMGAAAGISFGICMGMIMDNLAVGIIFGVAIGTSLACGTTTITNYK